MAITRRLARPLLASVFLVGGAQVLRDPAAAAVQARSFSDRVGPALRARGIPLPQDPLLLARANAVVQLGAAAALATGRAPRTSAAVLIASLVPSTILAHPFWSATDPEERRHHVRQAAKNASVAGGLVLAAVDTEGRPGVLWRTRRAARDARREARHLAHTATLEARLAASSLPHPRG